jgi:hypothetical protein
MNGWQLGQGVQFRGAISDDKVDESADAGWQDFLPTGAVGEGTMDEDDGRLGGS